MVSFRKKWRGGIKSPPAGFCSAKSFCFPAADRQEISNPKAYLPPLLFVGKSPQSEGAGGSGIQGTPLSGTSAQVLAAGRAVSWCLSLGRGWGTRALWALRPQRPPARPSRRLAAAARGSRGGGAAAPHNFKGESAFSSSPTPHQRIKKVKPNRGKDFVFFFPACLSFTRGRSPPKPTRCPPEPPKTASRRPQRPALCRADSSLLTICFSLGKVSGAILWPTHRGYICSKCWVASAG